MKFRPRRHPVSDVEIGSIKIKSKDVKYLLVKDKDPKKVGIFVFLPGYVESERSKFLQFGYLFLDEALGEYSVEMKLGSITFFGHDSKYFSHSHPINKLAKDFDNLFKN